VRGGVAKLSPHKELRSVVFWAKLRRARARCDCANTRRAQLSLLKKDEVLLPGASVRLFADVKLN
jgi:hypothetical protein